jgi:hypothetical protein
MNLYVGLIHSPIKNKNGELVTTSVTNMDVHDISRSCKTFGVKQYHIVTPLEVQHQLIQRILGHWERDENGAYNPDRQDALGIARISYSIEESIKTIEEEEGKRPYICVTGANFENFDMKANQVKEKALVDNRPIFLLFGTGWGLHAKALELADFHIEPLYGAHPEGYNHLSVRSAVAIYLDRIMVQS